MYILRNLNSWGLRMARTKAKIAGELRTSDFLTLASLMGVIPYAAVLEAM